MTSPERPSEEKFRLRVTVSDPEVDVLLARLSREVDQPYLPDYLFAFSEAAYSLRVDDEDGEGFSEKRHTFDQYRRHVNDYDRSTFSATSRVETRGHFLRLGVHLGHEAAKRLIVPPPFTFSQEEVNTNVLHVYYPVEGTAQLDLGVARELKTRLTEKEGAVFDELVLVNMSRPFEHVAVRPPRSRTIATPDDILQV